MVKTHLRLRTTSSGSPAPSGLPAAPSASGPRLPAQGCASWVSGAMGTPSPWRRGWGRSGPSPGQGRRDAGPALRRRRRARNAGPGGHSLLLITSIPRPRPPELGPAPPGTALRRRALPGPPRAPPGSAHGSPGRRHFLPGRSPQARTALGANRALSSRRALWGDRSTAVAAAGLPGAREVLHQPRFCGVCWNVMDVGLALKARNAYLAPARKKGWDSA